MEQQRDQNRIQHHKKQERINVRKGNPIASSFTQGVPQTWEIPGKGLYNVEKYGNKLYYSKLESGFSDGSQLYWDDLQVNISSVRLPTSNAPTWTAYRDSYILAFSDSSDNIIYFTAQLPHSYKIGSNIEFHLHTAIPTAGSGGGAENIKWDFTYSWASINDSFPASSSSTVTIDVQNRSANIHTLDEIDESIAGSGKGISSFLLCSLERDTSVANNYADDVYLVGLDFHFQKDALGSRQESSK